MRQQGFGNAAMIRFGHLTSTGDGGGSSNVGHAANDSLVTFEGEDFTTPKPSLATSWKVWPEGGLIPSHRSTSSPHLSAHYRPILLCINAAMHGPFPSNFSASTIVK